jgi:hypothetical protein
MDMTNELRINRLVEGDPSHSLVWGDLRIRSAGAKSSDNDRRGDLRIRSAGAKSE